MRIAALLATIVIGASAFTVSRCLACDTDAIQRRVQGELDRYELTALSTENGIVTLVLSPRRSEGRIAVALHASGTKLFTSIAGRQVDDASLAIVGRVVEGWAGDSEFLHTLDECGMGFPDTVAADPGSALRTATNDALTRQGRLSLGGPSWRLTGLVSLAGIFAVFILPLRWQSRGIVTLAIVAALLPLGWMILQTVGMEWVATGDQALIELRTRDVGSIYTPLVGAYSRYGWNHPGPLLFWLLAIPYRLAGGASWAILAGAGVLNLLAVAGTLWTAWRMGGLGLTCCAGLGVTLLVTGLNVDCVDPWNPLVAVLPFVLLIATAWAATEGDPSVIIPAALAGSFVVQAHVGHAAPVAALLLFVAMRVSHAKCSWRVGLASAGVLAVCWAPVLYDQFFGSGNLGSIISYFAQDRHAIGWPAGLGIAARELSPMGPWMGFPELGNDNWQALPASSSHLIASVALFVGSALVACRQRAWKPVRLQLAVGLTAGAAVLVTSRISDVAVWWLLRWWWAIAMWWWTSIAWSLLESIPLRRVTTGISCLLACVALAVSIHHVSSIDIEATRGSDQAAVRAIAPAAQRAVAGHGPVVFHFLDNQRAIAIGDGLALQMEAHGIAIALAERQEQIKFGQRWLGQPIEGSTVFIVGTDDSIENLQRTASEKIPLHADLRLVASFGDRPTNTVAVFSYLTRPVSPDL